MQQWKLALVGALMVTPLAARPAQELRTTRGVHTTALDVRVSIIDGVATTTLKQTIRNDSTVPMAEAIWVLPLPEGAAADDFEMLVDGVRMTGEVLQADSARTVYENIVRRRRDPGLLEYLGRGCLRARVFPIPAGKEIGVEISYRHVLPSVAGLARWSFPAKAAGVDGRPPASITLDLSIQSRHAIKNAFSPNAAVDVFQRDDHSVRASFEGGGSTLPSDELAVLYGLSDKDFGLNLLTHKATDEKEGTFLMLLSPKRAWGEEVIVKKDITFVVDTSGSMAGVKIDQAKASLLFFLRSLRPTDRFNVIPFSTEPRPFFRTPVDATKENVERAIGLVEQVRAVGGTNISEALRSALATSNTRDEDGRIAMVVFLTDGVPTVGATSPKDILREVRRAKRDETRIFVLGVGHDVNTHLLDSIASETRGTRNYIHPEEDIELKASALLMKIANPVLTDLELRVDGIQISRTVPAKLSDLFEGERVEVFGRYTGSGPTAIRLTGRFRGAERQYVFEGTFAHGVVSELEFLPRLWAQRRVGVLLDAIRLSGENKELVDEVTRLGRAFHIVTPYTSHLIVEQEMLASGPRGARITRSPSSPAGPTTPGVHSGAANTGSDGFFMGRGRRHSERDARLDLDSIASSLRTNEVVASDAPDDEVEELAREVIVRIHAASEKLKKLRKTKTVGKDAVAQSEYLRNLIRGGKSGEGRALFELFTRHVGDKVFRLQRGVWTDRAIADESVTRKRRSVEAFSTDYFELLREHPELRQYFALGIRVAVLLNGLVIEVAPAT